MRVALEISATAADVSRVANELTRTPLRLPTADEGELARRLEQRPVRVGVGQSLAQLEEIRSSLEARGVRVRWDVAHRPARAAETGGTASRRGMPDWAVALVAVVIGAVTVFAVMRREGTATSAAVVTSGPSLPVPSPEPRLDPEVVARSTLTVRTRYGNGTGFVVARGHVLTNLHVVAKDMGPGSWITIDIGSSAPRMEPVREDAQHDLAYLRCPPSDERCWNLPPLPLGEGAAVRVGETVYALGSPAGLERTLTRGIISHRGRLMNGVAYLQTDLAVNPGNSGGPMFNEQGRVVGVVTAKLSAVEGIAFALPIEYSATARGAGKIPPSVLQLVAEATPLEGPRGTEDVAAPGPRPPVGDLVIEEFVTNGWQQYGLTFKLTVAAAQELSEDREFTLWLGGQEVPLGRIAPRNILRRTTEGRTTYSFEYQGVFVGRMIKSGEEVVVAMGEEAISPPLVIRDIAVNFRIK